LLVDSHIAEIDGLLTTMLGAFQTGTPDAS